MKMEDAALSAFAVFFSQSPSFLDSHQVRMQELAKSLGCARSAVPLRLKALAHALPVASPPELLDQTLDCRRLLGPEEVALPSEADIAVRGTRLPH